MQKKSGGWSGRAWSLVWVAFASVLLAGLAVPAAAGAASPLAPSVDPFYTAPPRLASYAPGTILRSREVSVPGLIELASTTAYQLLYRTTDATGQPIATVTTLILPLLPAPGPRKLLSYQTAEDSLTTNCAPSYTMRGGNFGGTSQHVESLEIAAGLQRGWVVVVPDYEGPRSEWTVGPLAGRATLDSIRAVEQFAPAGLDGTRTPVGMMGYSGGSIPTLWANALASSYAPELNLVGAASGGNVPDLIQAIGPASGGPFAGAIIGVMVGINRAYPQLDLSGLLNAHGNALAAKDGTDAVGCGGSVTNAPFQTVGQLTNYPTPQALQAVPRVRQVFAKINLIGGPVPKAPSYIFQSAQDELSVTPPVDQMVASNCARGAVIDYSKPLGEHLTGSILYLLPSLNYLQDRFAGKPAPDNCPVAPHRTR